MALFVSAMNADRVEVELAFLRIATPLGLALVVAFAAGLVAGLIWRVYWVAELLNERGRLRRALRLAEQRARARPPRGKMPADPPLLLIVALFVAAAAGWLFGASLPDRRHRRRRSARTHASPRTSQPASPNEYFLGLSFLLDEEPDKALEVFLRMVDVDNETVETHFALGNLSPPR